MRILMAGASGFLGTPLAERLRLSGHDVTELVRGPVERGGQARWTPSQGQLDPGLVADADVVVNLAGANVGGKRWTARYKSVLRSSRLDTTGTLAKVIKELPAADRPRVLLQASAVGWYGDTGDTEVTEQAPAGNTFLADLCRTWEAAARPAEDAGTRVVLLRTAASLGPGSALIKPLLPLFRLGGGARMGSGRQWLPWIALPDWLGAVEFVLGREEVAGPVNLVSPHPSTNNDFTKALARAVRRPAVLAVPGFALAIGLGEMAGEVLGSQRVLPAVLEQAGFRWEYPDLDAAMRIAVEGEPTARP